MPQKRLRGDAIWYQDLRVLFRRDRLLEFFPTRDHSFAERVNAIVRLVAYSCAGMYLYNRDTRYVVYGLLSIALLTCVYGCGGGTGSSPSTARKPAPAGSTCVQALDADPACTLPTVNNPYANVLVSDYSDNPDRPPACQYDDVADLVKDKFNKGGLRDLDDVYDENNGQSTFYTMPVTTTMPDTKAFAEFVYGDSFQRNCKMVPATCTGFR